MWYYGDKEIKSLDDIPVGAIGFVYSIYVPDMHLYYIGKKNLYATRTLPPLKGYTRKRKIQGESNWLKYHGSNETIKDLVSQGYDIYKDILKFAYSTKSLTYWETKYLFCSNALEDECYLNGNILGKFYPGDNL